MSSPRVHRTPSATRGASVRQLPSHAPLLTDLSRTSAPSGRAARGRLDALIVPAARPASAVANLVELAAALDIMIVVLCSLQADFTQVADRIRRTPGARGIAIGVDDVYRLPAMLTSRTSSTAFLTANGDRTSDLSVKRNVGLLLARLLGWRKIAFVDDDITLSGSGLERLADQLDNSQIAGMACHDFPDNSVLCHARRLAGLPQDVFVTGAVLGVSTSDIPVPFFPDIYNEDWFFFSESAAHHELAKVGEARQAAYNPYEESRARHEEFGDLLAEGLYSLIQDGCWTAPPAQPGFTARLAAVATERYWSTFIDVRRHDLVRTRERLEESVLREDRNEDQVLAAIKSLNAAEALYDSTAITEHLCVAFLEAWADDTAAWNAAYARTGTVKQTRDAMDELGLSRWEQVR